MKTMQIVNMVFHTDSASPVRVRVINKMLLTEYDTCEPWVAVTTVIATQDDRPLIRSEMSVLTTRPYDDPVPHLLKISVECCMREWLPTGTTDTYCGEPFKVHRFQTTHRGWFRKSLNLPKIHSSNRVYLVTMTRETSHAPQLEHSWLKGPRGCDKKPIAPNQG